MILALMLSITSRIGANESVSFFICPVAISSKLKNRYLFLKRFLAMVALKSGFDLLLSSEKRLSRVSLCNQNKPISIRGQRKHIIISR